MKNKRYTVSIRNMIMALVIVNPLIALFFDGLPIYRYILEPVVTILLLFESSREKRRFKNNIFILFLITASCIYTLFENVNLARIYLHLFCYLNFIFFIYFMTDKSNQKYVFDFLKLHVRYLKSLVIFVNIVEAFMMITGRGYVNRFHWGGDFFYGTSSMPHTMSYLMLVVIAIIIIIIMIEKNKYWFLCALVPFLAIFQSGARISLVLASFLLLIIIDQVLTSKQKSIAIKLFVVVLLVGIILFIFRDRILSSSMWTKIIKRSGDSYNMTAGRTVVWGGLIEKFFGDSSFLEFFLGHGDDRTYYYNAINPLVRNAIWAHNDYLQILVGKGIIGFCLYIAATYNFIKSILKQNSSVYKWSIVLFVLLAALLNGFYSYRDMTMAIPFFAIIGMYYGKGNKKYT